MPTTQNKYRPFQLLKRGFRITSGRYRELNAFGKLVVWAFALFYVLAVIFAIIVTPKRIAQFCYDNAQKLTHLRFGWAVLFMLMVLDSFPPFIGNTTLITLCGFAYGMNGFWIASSGALIGSSVAFVVLRYFFAKRVRNWSGSNEKWQALEAVVRAKGLPLIILIRMSPFPPWVYSNSLFASIEAVKLWQFALATTFVFPKILLYVFTGSKIASMSDGDQRDRMDTPTKIANWLLIGSGIFISGFAGWLIYYLVKGQILKMHAVSPEIDELAAEALDEADEGAPLLREFSTPGENA